MTQLTYDAGIVYSDYSNNNKRVATTREKEMKKNE